MWKSEISTLSAGIDGLNERIMGAEAQRAAIERQIAIIAEELEGKEKLLSDGFVRRPEVLALRRAQAGLDGEVGRLVGDMGDSRERIARINEQILSVRNAAAKVAVEQSQEVEAELKDVRERRRAAADMVERSAIIALEDGWAIVKMRYSTRRACFIEAPGAPVRGDRGARLFLMADPRQSGQPRAPAGYRQRRSRIGQSASVAPHRAQQSASGRRWVEGRGGPTSPPPPPAGKKKKKRYAPLRGGTWGGTRGEGRAGRPSWPRIRLDARLSSLKVSDFAPTPGMPAEALYTRRASRKLRRIHCLQPVKDSNGEGIQGRSEENCYSVTKNNRFQGKFFTEKGQFKIPICLI